MNRRLTGLSAALVAAVLLVTGCGSDSTGNASGGTDTSTAAGDASAAEGSGAGDSGAAGSDSADGTGGKVTGTVTVYAAASLTASFDALAKDFEAKYPGTTVKLSYDGSSTLVTQLIGGAPADVFASADEKNMAKATDASLLAGTPALFASNTLQIAVAPGNPKKISGLADLAKSDVVTVLCAAEVPCGSAAHTALDAAKVTVTPASEEENVKAVLTKVSTGEADAGLVYKTDVAASAGKVDGIDFPEAAQAVNKYPIGVLKTAPNAAGGQAFVDLVTSDAGQKVLAGFGFAGP
ncbi:molybdate ABC transporter substrate-binding protein [Nakamurella lactea]|uniref:molybdate ABC transporter substrate-binding protein n=1 Tax=Nakamurella lactea TaxID=459515 RepID=UPI0003F4B2E0|nr:molybdate ABC transporter substrate-binding protein [Nakamurella lactea]